MNEEPWYGAKLVFQMFHDVQNDSYKYEERVVLVHAPTEHEAMQKAETFAKAYETDRITYVGFVQLFHIFDDVIGDGTEVFSLIRDSQLTVDEYLDHFYDTGGERERKSVD